MNGRELDAIFKQAGVTRRGIFVFTTEPGADGATLYSRMVGRDRRGGSGDGFGQRPARLLRRAARPRAGGRGRRARERQGVKMGRPSRIHIRLAMSGIRNHEGAGRRHERARRRRPPALGIAMIVRPGAGVLHLITQPDHAALARRIMEHWSSLAKARGGATSCTAIEHHDRGWAEPDAALTVDPATATIRDFVSVPAAVRQSVWPRSVGRSGRGAVGRGARGAPCHHGLRPLPAGCRVARLLPRHDCPARRAPRARRRRAEGARARLRLPAPGRPRVADVLHRAPRHRIARSLDHPARRRAGARHAQSVRDRSALRRRGARDSRRALPDRRGAPRRDRGRPLAGARRPGGRAPVH